jgi:hypothetical protein
MRKEVDKQKREMLEKVEKVKTGKVSSISFFSTRVQTFYAFRFI